MILAHTCVWIGHIRSPDTGLIKLLQNDSVLCHPIIIGELAVGNLPKRRTWLDSLARLPAASVSRHHEVLGLIEDMAIYGRGVGYNDAHLLASARLSRCRLWTLDKRLATVAAELGVGYAEG